MADLNAMTLDELEQHQQAINAERATLKAQAQAVQAVIDRKQGEATLKRRLETMSDAEKAALVQMVHTGGIETNGAVGTPGR